MRQQEGPSKPGPAWIHRPGTPDFEHFKIFVVDKESSHATSGSPTESSPVVGAPGQGVSEVLRGVNHEGPKNTEDRTD